MTKPTSTDVVFANNQLRPLEYEGVKLMSMGFINKGASIMRGPMVNQVSNCVFFEIPGMIFECKTVSVTVN